MHKHRRNLFGLREIEELSCKEAQSLRLAELTRSSR